MTLAFSQVASAYDQPVHDYLSRHAYPNAAAPPPCSPESLSAFRAVVWQLGANLPDAALRARFIARFPKPFDAWDFKEFLSLNPEKSVVGIDRCLEAKSASELYGLASRAPDDDQRNQARVAYDAARHVRHDAYGRPLPRDPATLEMGGLDGLSSQAHAHYALPKIELSDDPELLKKDPRRFAIPPTVHTFGAEFAEMYTALAVIAASRPETRGLALLFAGAAAHHIEDVANQIHTVQVGIYDFFFDAKIESIKEELRSGGGLFHERLSFRDIGKQILTNYHQLAEALFAKHLLTAGDPVAVKAEHPAEDSSLTQALNALAAGCAKGFGRAITEAVIDRSSYEGAQVYAAIRKLAEPRFSKAHVVYEGDPDLALRKDADPAHFYDLQLTSIGRAYQALAAWWSHFEACAHADSQALAPEIAAFFTDRLNALDAEDARLAKYVPSAPPERSINAWVPATYAILFVGLALYIGVKVVRRRTKATRG